MVVRITEVSGAADTAEQGGLISEKLRAELASGEAVLSFEGVQTATSSFVNVALVPLVEEFGLSILKKRLKVIQSTRQINEMIRQRLERAAKVSD